mgnify:CR=1 FL=1
MARTKEQIEEITERFIDILAKEDMTRAEMEAVINKKLDEYFWLVGGI